MTWSQEDTFSINRTGRRQPTATAQSKPVEPMLTGRVGMSQFVRKYPVFEAWRLTDLLSGAVSGQDMVKGGTMTGPNRRPCIAASFGKIRQGHVDESEKSDLEQGFSNSPKRNPSATNCFSPVPLWHGGCSVRITET